MVHVSGRNQEMECTERIKRKWGGGNKTWETQRAAAQRTYCMCVWCETITLGKAALVVVTTLAIEVRMIVGELVNLLF